MKQVKWFPLALVLLLVLGLATSAVAQLRPAFLYDSEEPGSVIVFPKFVTGTVDGQPRSEFEISLVCPPALRLADGSCDLLAEGTRFKLKAEWVCPGSQKVEDKFICKETDFELFVTLNGTVSFNPNNIGAGPFPTPAPGTGTPPTLFSPTVTAQRVSGPPCERGYVIVWVVNINGTPIKFDGLIGDAILREANGATSAYNGIPIQANPFLATNAPVPQGLLGALAFDGLAAGYQSLTGSIASSVRFAQSAPTPVRTDLTLLTLDVFSNRPNAPVSVDLDFFNANEVLLSTSTEFICWDEVQLTEIDPNLTVDGMQTRKGLVVSGPAIKFPFLGINDPTVNPVTGFASLLGIVTTVEGSQAYSYSLFNDSGLLPGVGPITTLFIP
jgi:hypothetical protein